MDLIGLLRRKILVLDGAMGTMLKHVPCDEYSLTHPEKVAEVHEKYLMSGADIIQTNTFNNISEEINRASIQLARQEAQKFSNRFVAGTLGPSANEKLINLFIEEKVDLLLIETIMNSHDCIRLLKEIKIEIPIFVSVTLNQDSKMISGESLNEFVHKVSPYPITGIGINCGFGVDDIFKQLEMLNKLTNKFISVHPNSGVPHIKSLHEFAKRLEQVMQSGLVNIVGGCCGTTEEHIAKLSKLAQIHTPRTIL